MRITRRIVIAICLVGSGVAHAQTPQFSKSFNRSSILVAENATLTFTIDNSATGVETTGLSFVDVLPLGLQVATPPNASTTCGGGSITAIAETGSISYSGGAVSANSSCTVKVDVYATAAGMKNNVSGDLTSSEGNSGPATDDIEVIQPVVFKWANPGTGDWYDSGNWDQGAVPSLDNVAMIVNGGTADTVISQPAIRVHSLVVGQDGGDGTLLIGHEFDGELEVHGETSIGVTLSGAVATNGLVEFGDRAFGFISSSPFGPLRVGVSKADGDATGTFRFLFNALGLPADFGAIQVGVSEGGGSAVGAFTTPRVSSYWPTAVDSVLEVGIARSSGNANGTMHFPVSRFSTVLVGVAGSTGSATGQIYSHREFSGTFNEELQGEAWIGVSQGVGAAEGVVDLELTRFDYPVDRFSALNIGIANSTGAAAGTLRTSSGINVPTINAGISHGGGSAEGLIYVDHGLLTADALTLGPGASLQFAAYLDNRATDGLQGEIYSAADVNHATLAGELVLDLQYIPEGPTSFEVINSAMPDGLAGIFDVLTVRNLPNGFTASQSVQLDGEGNEQLIVELQGAPVLPLWTNPNTEGAVGNWFDGANWSTGLVPTENEPPTINNGGHAMADIGTAPGPVVGSAIAVGKDGGEGTFTSDGVDVETTFNFMVGQASPFDLVEQTAIGVATVSDADIVVSGAGGGVSSYRNLVGIGVGVAQGNGSSDGQLSVTDGSLYSPTDIYVGAALPVADNASPTASGQLTFNGSGVGASQFETTDFHVIPGDLHIGLAEVIPGNTNPVATASAQAAISDATIDADVVIANVFLNGENAVGQATANPVTLSNVAITDDLEISIIDSQGAGNQSHSESNVTIAGSQLIGPDSEIDIGLVEVSGAGAVASANSTVEMTNVSFVDAVGWTEIGEAIAEDGASATVTSVANFSGLVLDSNNGFLVSQADATSVDSQASIDTSVRIINSDLDISMLLISDVSGGAAVVSDLTRVELADSTLDAERFVIARTDAAEASLLNVDVVVDVTNATLNLSEYLWLGDVQFSGSDEDSAVAARLNLTGTSVTADGVWLNMFSLGSGQLETLMDLNSSVITTGSVLMRSRATAVFHINGLTRAQLGNQGQPGTYAAIDAGRAELDGEIVARFNFIPEAGTHVFDLLITGENGVWEPYTATFSVEGLDPGFTVDFFDVVEDGTDIVRLQISGSPIRVFSDGFEG